METDFMTLISENYVAIIIIAVVILMTIIGYFADKKDYSKKDKKVDKKQPKEIEDEDIMTEDTSFVDEPVMEEVEPVQTEEPVEDTSLYDSFEMPTDVEPTEEDKMDVPTEETVEPTAEETVEPVMEEVKPVETVEPVQTEEPVVEDITFNPEESQDFQLPNIDKLNEELSTVDDDEDVWKF